MAIELANHIYRDGEGVPVVLMNAYPVDHRMWDVCAKALADFADLNDVPDFPIWAPDMAGSGASPVPSDADSGPRMANGAYSEALDRLAGAYVDLIKAAGYEQAIWVGLSMGALRGDGHPAPVPRNGGRTGLVRHDGRVRRRGRREPTEDGGRRRTDELGRTGDALRAAGRWRFHRQEDS